MKPSAVFFTDLHTQSGQNLLDKLGKLAEKAGIFGMNLDRKLAAIKIHFGEPGNLAALRPNFSRKIAEMLRSKGAIPYLTDSNTLYKGRRSNAPDHLISASENGYSLLTAGCPVVIADGVRGTEYREIPLGLKYCKTAKIGSGVADADVLISMNHFKGHDMTGFGGALKNLGMGSASVGGKLELHSDSQPTIAREKCTGCGLCMKNCAHGAVTLGPDHVAIIDYSKCVGCGQCVAVCRFDAAQVVWSSNSAQEKIAEYALAAVSGKEHLHFNFVFQISPNCDCWSHNDLPIVPDIGILASRDPVALDRASVDLVNAAPVLKGSVLDGKGADTGDKFKALWPNSDWKAGLDYAESIGLGSQKYELVKV